jgi:deoxyribodipyrimidine photo-lyase
MNNTFNEVSILLFRQDLRIDDNPALYYAAKTGKIIAVYILDEKNNIGGASRWWLYQSLKSLAKSLKDNYQAELYLFQGDSAQIINSLCKKYSVTNIFCNKIYDPNWDIVLHSEHLKKINIKTHEFNSNLLHEPFMVNNESGGHYKVFTPFWKKLQTLEIRNCFPRPQASFMKIEENTNLEKINILPENNWHDKFNGLWQVGEKNALIKLDNFIESKVNLYKNNRDVFSENSTSLLSPHLAFGEISPVTIWHKVRKNINNEGETCFLSEIAWREFSYYLLYHFPELPRKCWNSKYDNFPWQYNQKLFDSWKEGKTGYPLVDAGMKQLWQTGWMHNRARMVTASFLVKNLLIPWQIGAAWFWDCLVDADIASNSASWQWVAGCGADAAPFFRIFNPELQQQRFDPKEKYIKQWTDTKQISFKIVDFPMSRNKALAALKSLP